MDLMFQAQSCPLPAPSLLLLAQRCPGGGCPAPARVTAHPSAPGAPPARHQLIPTEPQRSWDSEGPLEMLWSCSQPTPPTFGVPRRAFPPICPSSGCPQSSPGTQDLAGDSPSSALWRGTEVSPPGYGAAGARRWSRELTAKPTPGDTAERRRGLHLSPHLCRFQADVPVPGRPKPRPGKPNGSECAPRAGRRCRAEPSAGAGGSVCDKPEQHGGWQ